jgi:hypothetical protein
MSRIFDLKSGVLAIGDPTKGFAHYELRLAPGTYRLGPEAFLPADRKEDPASSLINLDSGCIFALDGAHAELFMQWYHQVGARFRFAYEYDFGDCGRGVWRMAWEANRRPHPERAIIRHEWGSGQSACLYPCALHRKFVNNWNSRE